MIKYIHEHYNGLKAMELIDFNDQLPFDEDYFYQFTRKFRNEKVDCFRIYSDKENKTHHISNSYFIGVDWIIDNERAIYIQPKLNKETATQTDYLKMLFSALKHPEVAQHTEDLFEIKWDKPTIAIDQEQDLLTPLLIVQFLNVVRQIVRKGLKKSYYKVETNLKARVKGKILVSQTVKYNLAKNKPLNTYCSYDEFGLNGLENRLLKKALVFVQRFLPSLKNLQEQEYISEMLSYINPGFELVSDEVSLNDIKHTKTNIFYKEYEEAIHLAKLILKRFGYNISNTQGKTINTPPFWIDMSKLFELYVLGLLKDSFGKNVLYGLKEAKAKFGLPDYLITRIGQECIIDAKYKLIYNDKNRYDIDNIRQLSGYSRDTEVIAKLGKGEDDVIECVVIYPIKNADSETIANFKIDFTESENIEQFTKFKTLGVPVPSIQCNKTPDSDY